ncbi:hypothetical protein NH342_01900 [Klenkia sp. PcliD-1-E]|nr:hypothetical protein [Klenkia sp. PcliD-1-E]
MVDDLFGFLLYGVGQPAVTRTLSVSYRAPVLLGVEYRVSAHLERREGRKLFLVAEVADAQGFVLAEASALFIVVELEHFDRARRRPEHP